MTLFQDTGGDPRAGRTRLADVLSWYGAVSDAAMGNPAGFAVRKASLAVALSEVAETHPEERDALYFAGLLHAVGAIGSPAYRKGETLTDRVARMERWDVPALGARFASAIGILPPEVSDMIRWQAECWDGTGHPDQLRWHGIPQSAQLLAMADAYLRSADPEEALGAIGLDSGRAFGPDHVRTFTMWFHRNAGDVTELSPPADCLQETKPADELLDVMADAIDAHNGVTGRWRRIAALGLGAAEHLGLDTKTSMEFALAARLFGAGEVAQHDDEDEQFDPLARLGIDVRAANAAQAATLAASYASLRAGAEAIAARSEWFDGTGKPKALRGKAIPMAAALLAAAIAYDGLDRAERLDDAAGTQFDPQVVRALMSTAKAHA